MVLGPCPKLWLGASSHWSTVSVSKKCAVGTYQVCQLYQVCQHKEDTIEASMSTPGKASLLTTATNVLPKFCGNVDLSQ